MSLLGGVRSIDFAAYIDGIQSAIGTISKEIGAGRDESEREEGRRRLMQALVPLSQRMTTELGLRGDYNISLVLGVGMLAAAWAAFILKAKSLDSRRLQEERDAMAVIVNELPLVFSEIFQQAIAYGSRYDQPSG